jgi:hypothetical protein
MFFVYHPFIYILFYGFWVLRVIFFSKSASYPLHSRSDASFANRAIVSVSLSRPSSPIFLAVHLSLWRVTHAPSISALRLHIQTFFRRGNIFFLHRHCSTDVFSAASNPPSFGHCYVFFSTSNVRRWFRLVFVPICSRLDGFSIWETRSVPGGAPHSQPAGH